MLRLFTHWTTTTKNISNFAILYNRICLRLFESERKKKICSLRRFLFCVSYSLFQSKMYIKWNQRPRQSYNLNDRISFPTDRSRQTVQTCRNSVIRVDECLSMIAAVPLTRSRPIAVEQNGRDNVSNVDKVGASLSKVLGEFSINNCIFIQISEKWNKNQIRSHRNYQ